MCLFINIYFCHCSVSQSCPTLCDPMNGSTSGFPVLHYLPEFTHVHWVSDVSQPSHPLLLLSPLALNLSNIRVFSNESALGIRWPKYWSFNFSISSSKEYSGLISFRINWFDLLAFPRDSQESSPAPQFKSTNSSVLCLIYCPALTSVHDYYSFDYTDLCWQSDVFAF